MRFRSLRRSRGLPVLLLVLSPAMAGTALPVLHPCPVDTPVAHAPASHAGHHTGQTVPASHHCTCIGCCTLSAATRASGPVLPQRVRVFVSALPWSARDATLALAPLATLLPPSTAPPLA